MERKWVCSSSRRYLRFKIVATDNFPVQGSNGKPASFEELMRVDSTLPSRSAFVRTKSDEYFIETNNLDLRKSKDTLKYLLYLLEKKVDVKKLPYTATFHDNCLEYRLDRRSTSYDLDSIVDNVDNVKLILAVSGAGKTRMLLELLNSNFGYYFTSKSSQVDFGSGDLYVCQGICDRQPELAKHSINLLYFVRAAVCNYLKEKGFREPWQILLAQIHPVAFFGIDLFEYLFTSLVKEPHVGTAIVNSFPLAVIDEIQVCVESLAVHSLPGSNNLRPFFSPFVHFSKHLGIFPQFFLSGTGINFQFVKEAMESSTMKKAQITNYEVISNFHPLSKNNVEQYATQFLQQHQVFKVDEIVSRISAFELCHGRPRFLAFILDRFMESRDIDVAIGEFASGIFTVESQIFPLRFFKRDLDNNKRSFDRVISGDTLSRVIREGLLEVILKGRYCFRVSDDNGAAAIRYGLGFGDVTSGILKEIEVQELAVVECLRYFIPFANLVKTFALKIAECPKPQMVGYLLEYLVSFAMVVNYSGDSAANNVKAWQDLPYLYLRGGDKTEVCFPDHMCGPDIIYKCASSNIVYIVQVKFVKKISKQEAANACATTDPEKFYCKRKGKGVLKGFEEKRSKLRSRLKELQCDGYALQQMVFIHSREKATSFTQGTLVVNKTNCPDYFNKVGGGIWEFLDSVREEFQSEV